MTRLIAIGWGEGSDGAVLEIPADTTAEALTRAYEAVEVASDSAYNERFHIVITQIAARLGGRVVTEEWHHLRF